MEERGATSLCSCVDLHRPDVFFASIGAPGSTSGLFEFRIDRCDCLLSASDQEAVDEGQECVFGQDVLGVRVAPWETQRDECIWLCFLLQGRVGPTDRPRKIIPWHELSPSVSLLMVRSSNSRGILPMLERDERGGQNEGAGWYRTSRSFQRKVARSSNRQ